MLIFALMLVAAESGAPTAGVAEAVVNVEYKYINCPPSSQWAPADSDASMCAWDTQRDCSPRQCAGLTKC